eukprot:gene1237-32582_t
MSTVSPLSCDLVLTTFCGQRITTRRGLTATRLSPPSSGPGMVYPGMTFSPDGRGTFESPDRGRAPYSPDRGAGYMRSGDGGRGPGPYSRDEAQLYGQPRDPRDSGSGFSSRGGEHEGGYGRERGLAPSWGSSHRLDERLPPPRGHRGDSSPPRPFTREATPPEREWEHPYSSRGGSSRAHRNSSGAQDSPPSSPLHSSRHRYSSGHADSPDGLKSAPSSSHPGKGGLSPTASRDLPLTPVGARTSLVAADGLQIPSYNSLPVLDSEEGAGPSLQRSMSDSYRPGGLASPPHPSDGNGWTAPLPHLSRLDRTPDAPLPLVTGLRQSHSLGHLNSPLPPPRPPSMPDAHLPPFSSGLEAGEVPTACATGPEPGYAAKAPGYTANVSGYSATVPGYATTVPVYAANESGYDAKFKPEGYPAAVPGYASTVPGYAASEPAYDAKFKPDGPHIPCRLPGGVGGGVGGSTPTPAPPATSMWPNLSSRDPPFNPDASSMGGLHVRPLKMGPVVSMLHDPTLMSSASAGGELGKASSGASTPAVKPSASGLSMTPSLPLLSPADDLLNTGEKKSAGGRRFGFGISRRTSNPPKAAGTGGTDPLTSVNSLDVARSFSGEVGRSASGDVNMLDGGAAPVPPPSWDPANGTQPLSSLPVGIKTETEVDLGATAMPEGATGFPLRGPGGAPPTGPLTNGAAAVAVVAAVVVAAAVAVPVGVDPPPTPWETKGLALPSVGSSGEGGVSLPRPLDPPADSGPAAATRMEVDPVPAEASDAVLAVTGSPTSAQAAAEVMVSPGRAAVKIEEDMPGTAAAAASPLAQCSSLSVTEGEGAKPGVFTTLTGAPAPVADSPSAPPAPEPAAPKEEPDSAEQQRQKKFERVEDLSEQIEVLETDISKLETQLSALEASNKESAALLQSATFDVSLIDDQLEEAKPSRSPSSSSLCSSSSPSSDENEDLLDLKPSGSNSPLVPVSPASNGKGGRRPRSGGSREADSVFRMVDLSVALLHAAPRHFEELLLSNNRRCAEAANEKLLKLLPDDLIQDVNLSDAPAPTTPSPSETSPEETPLTVPHSTPFSPAPMCTEPHALPCYQECLSRHELAKESALKYIKFRRQLTLAKEDALSKQYSRRGESYMEELAAGAKEAAANGQSASVTGKGGGGGNPFGGGQITPSSRSSRHNSMMGGDIVRSDYQEQRIMNNFQRDDGGRHQYATTTGNADHENVQQYDGGRHSPQQLQNTDHEQLQQYDGGRHSTQQLPGTADHEQLPAVYDGGGIVRSNYQEQRIMNKSS